MKTHLKTIMVAAVFAAQAVPALAAPTLPGGAEVGLAAGTLGIGPQVSWTIVPDKIGARLSVGLLNYNYDTTADGLKYSGSLRLRNVGLLADWRPFAGRFHVTAGAYYNGNKLELSAQPNAGTYQINGDTYAYNDVGSVNATVSFNSIAPYLGLGWSNDGGEAGLHFTSDVGVMYQGKPSVSVTSTIPTQNAQLTADMAAAQAKLESKLSSYQWYPVLQVGFVYRF